MVSSKAIGAFATLLALSSAQYLVNPPTTAPNDTITDCTNWVVVGIGDTCAALASDNSITLEQFDTYNPSVGSSCVLIDGDSYCIEEDFGIPPASSITTSTSSTTSGDGVTTPAPIQTGMISTCDSFYLVASGDQYVRGAKKFVFGTGSGVTGMVSNCNTFHLVVSGDQCGAIASAYGISLASFYLWNPAVGSSCATLVLGDYVCVNVVGGSTSTTASSSSISTNGISTPTPIQTGMVTSCDTFYLVVSGDECGTIASSHGISLASFYLWNPAVGSSCTTLDVGDYVCVNVLGGTTSTSTTTTTTSKGDGISTPTPIQTGMVSTCDTFYLVVSGDQCGTIASSHGISLANFYHWNPAVRSSCATLDLGDYVCVNVIGGTTSTSVKATTTSAANGIATPTPYQAGMVSDCNKFHLVVSGDQCGTIATAAGITLATFYSWNPAVGSSCATLDLGDYACIGIL